MTVDEKRQALQRHCMSTNTLCNNCALHTKKVCRCGWGAGFIELDPEKSNYMSDAEIIGAYELAFPEQGCTNPEEVCAELAEIKIPEKVIINGKVKYLTINFFAKEE